MVHFQPPGRVSMLTVVAIHYSMRKSWAKNYGPGVLAERTPGKPSMIDPNTVPAYRAPMDHSKLLYQVWSLSKLCETESN